MYGHREKAQRKFRTVQSIALLLVHAERLERTAERFCFLRFFLIWLLRPVERAVRNHVFNRAKEIGAPDLPLSYGLLRDSVYAGDISGSASEALALALQMRTLASVIGIIATLEAQLNAADNAAAAKRDIRRAGLLAAAIEAVRVRRGCANNSGQASLGRPEVRPLRLIDTTGSGRFCPA